MAVGFDAGLEAKGFFAAIGDFFAVAMRTRVVCDRCCPHEMRPGEDCRYAKVVRALLTRGGSLDVDWVMIGAWQESTKHPLDVRPTILS